ncbi:cytochrome P450 [Gigaspora rosea]|uniref:Cytochrome P450 n=1 Tax=Gigaspora rosea TaxID=44941 RepID=A0A397TUL7_9GLOM|nr:cytochrome P450 [Gigaspora rosea]
MNYYLVAFVAFVGYFLYKCYIYPLYLSSLCKIPGPPVNNFILGHYASLLRNDLNEAFTHLARQYGGIVRLFFMKNVKKGVLGESIILAEGDSHKRQRKMMNPSFAFANVKEMFPVFTQAGHKLKDIWMKQIGNKEEERITITTLISKVTLDVIGLVGFNYEFNSTTSESKLVQAYSSIINANPPILFLALIDLFPFIGNIPNPYMNQFIESIKIIKNTSERLVAEQKNNPVQGKDLLSLLVKANENLPVDEQLTHDELIGQVMTFLVAGHETTSIALSWALYFLAKNPDIQDRLRKELLDVLTDCNHFPTYKEIEHSKYLECVLKETLRITPPVAILRRYNLKDEIMNGYVIPKKTPLVITIYAIHRYPLVWGDDAESFNPSRWLDPEIKSKVSNNNFLPFGAGTTNCLGMKMAQLEFKSILSFRLVEGFTFKKKYIDLTNNFLPFGAGTTNCLGMKMAQLEFKSILSVIVRNFEFRLVEGFTFKKKYISTKPIPGIDLLVSKIDY